MYVRDVHTAGVLPFFIAQLKISKKQRDSKRCRQTAAGTRIFVPPKLNAMQGDTQGMSLAVGYYT